MHLNRFIILSSNTEQSSRYPCIPNAVHRKIAHRTQWEDSHCHSSGMKYSVRLSIDGDDDGSSVNGHWARNYYSLFGCPLDKRGQWLRGLIGIGNHTYLHVMMGMGRLLPMRINIYEFGSPSLKPHQNTITMSPSPNKDRAFGFTEVEKKKKYRERRNNRKYIKHKLFLPRSKNRPESRRTSHHSIPNNTRVRTSLPPLNL